jgi:hypothetical protein
MAARVLLIGVLASLVAVLPLVGQEGHPLTGSWHGSWTPAEGRKPVMIYMKYDGDNIVGTINPGPNSVPLKTVRLNANTWMVHMEADAKDGSHIVIDGKMDNVGSYNRTIAGTWTQGALKGEYKITRD